MPDDHSKLVPLLPIPNRTVKRLSADDSADSRVKVGHRQAIKNDEAQSGNTDWAFFLLVSSQMCLYEIGKYSANASTLFLAVYFFQFRLTASLTRHS